MSVTKARNPLDRARAIAVDLRRYHDIKRFAGFADELVLAVARAADIDRMAPLPGHRVRRDRGVEAGNVTAQHFVPFITQQIQPAVAHRRQDSCAVAGVHRNRRPRVKRAVACLAVFRSPQRVFLAARMAEDCGRRQQQRDGGGQGQRAEDQRAREPFLEDVAPIDGTDDVERVLGELPISKRPGDAIDGGGRAVELADIGQSHPVHGDLTEAHRLVTRGGRRIGVARQDGSILAHQADAVARCYDLLPEFDETVRQNVQDGDSAERSVAVGEAPHDAEDRLAARAADKRAIDYQLGSRPCRLKIGAARHVVARCRRRSAGRSAINEAGDLPLALRIGDEDALDFGDAVDQIVEVVAEFSPPIRDLGPAQCFDTVGHARQDDRIRLQQPARVLVQQFDFSAERNRCLELHPIPCPPRHSAKKQRRPEDRGQQKGPERQRHPSCHRRAARRQSL